jgi:hypothetical protein
MDGRPAAFYVRDGDGWIATVHTRGPWSPAHQHGGPPAALIAHVTQVAAPEFLIARLTVDFLLPVPIDRLGVRLEPLRAGTKVQRQIARLLHGDTVVAHAVLTLIRRGASTVKPREGDAATLPPPETSRPFQFPFFREPVGYHTAMETRLAGGAWGSGRVAAWMRQRIPLLPDVPVSPLERVLVAADSGSGVSAAIDHGVQSAINADLTVALFRPLEGEWVGLDSVSTYEPTGVGLADTRLFDPRGTLGRVLQGLVLQERRDPR